LSPCHLNIASHAPPSILVTYPPPRCTAASASDSLRRSGHHRHLGPGPGTPSPSPAPRQPRRSPPPHAVLATDVNGQPLATSMRPAAPARRAHVPLFWPQEGKPVTGPISPPIHYVWPGHHIEISTYSVLSGSGPDRKHPPVMGPMPKNFKSVFSRRVSQKGHAPGRRREHQSWG
jgi:hypothetical protein